jgi:hypothetical protein
LVRPALSMAWRPAARDPDAPPNSPELAG